MEDFSIDPLRGIYTALGHRDSLIKDIADVGTGLGATPLVKVGDGVVVGVSDVVLCLVMLDDAAGVFLVTVSF